MKRKTHIPDLIGTFLGPMKSQLTDYVNENRALGKAFEAEVKILRSFDRFAAADGYGQVGLTEDLYWRWERSNPKGIESGRLPALQCTSREMITRHSFPHHLGE
jgi:hypothetical protein